MGDNVLYYRRRMPHYQPHQATFFVTFRLAGSLPVQAIIRLKEEQELRDLQVLKEPNDQKKRRGLDEIRSQHFERFDELLDAAKTGPQWLADSRVASVVVEATRYRDTKVYDLIAYCLMPNHVHMVFSVGRFAESLLRRDGVSRYIVTDILASLKKYTAREGAGSI